MLVGIPKTRLFWRGLIDFLDFLLDMLCWRRGGRQTDGHGAYQTFPFRSHGRWCWSGHQLQITTPKYCNKYCLLFGVGAKSRVVEVPKWPSGRGRT